MRCARRADVEVEFVVGSDGQELPPVRLIARQVVVDDRRLRRVAEVVLDIVDLRDLVQLRDVERAIVERDAIRPVQTRHQRLDLALAVLVGDGIDRVAQARADKNGSLVADPQ
jgi:hypothetical protein